MNKLDWILALVGALTIAFVVSMIFVFCRYGAVPDSLIAGVFALVGGEAGICGWIKSAKERKRERKWELEDRKAASRPKVTRRDNTQCSG